MQEPGQEKSLLARVLTGISGYCYKNPKISLGLCFAFFVLSLMLAFTQLKLKMDWTYLFEPDDPIVQKVEASRDIFQLTGDIVVLVD